MISFLVNGQTRSKFYSSTRFIDENVHFRHTARLLQALVTADIDHRLLLYPGERHLPRSEADRTSMERRIVDFLRGALA